MTMILTRLIGPVLSRKRCGGAALSRKRHFIGRLSSVSTPTRAARKAILPRSAKVFTRRSPARFRPVRPPGRRRRKRPVRRYKVLEIDVILHAPRRTMDSSKEVLKLRKRRSSKSYPRARRASLLLLCLFHAFLISATHCHRAEPRKPTGQWAGVSQAAEGGTQRSLESSAHAQCLLCRLQRDFLTDFRKRYVPGDPAPQAVSASNVSPSQTFPNGLFSSPSGRAPPLA
jgi:hypothetical protein